MLEFIAVLFGLLSVWYAKNNDIRVFPTGIISVSIYIFITYTAKLYADTGINIYYFIMSIYGWILWGSKNKNIKKQISRCNKNELLFSILLSIFFFLIIYYLLKLSDSDVPIVDSITTSLSLVAMLLMARRKIENWIYWIIADLIYIPLYFYKELPLTSFQFLVFLIIAISGLISWTNKLNEKNINHRTRIIW
tara:strand:- start:297 stop:875 length:579 start_codon:yes stop_codon:yes gene_type:complete